MCGRDEPVDVLDVRPESLNVERHRDERVRLRRIEIDDRHPDREGPRRLDLDPGRSRGEQVGAGDVGDSTHVVNDLAAPVRIVLVDPEGGKWHDQLGAEAAKVRHPFDHPGGSLRLQREIEADHHHLPVRVEHDSRGLWIGIDVELGRGGGVTPRARPAHDHEGLHQPRDAGVFPQRKGDVGERAGGNQVDAPRRRADRLDDEVGRVGSRHGELCRRKHQIAETGLAMHVRGILRLAHERLVSARGNGHVGEAQVFAQLERVLRGVPQPDVAADRGHPHELECGVAVREQQRERVVEPGVAVEQNLGCHESTVPHRVALHRQQRRCGCLLTMPSL